MLFAISTKLTINKYNNMKYFMISGLILSLVVSERIGFVELSQSKEIFGATEA